MFTFSLFSQKVLKTGKVLCMVQTTTFSGCHYYSADSLRISLRAELRKKEVKSKKQKNKTKQKNNT
jgi:hypothetical protein